MLLGCINFQEEVVDAYAVISDADYNTLSVG